MFICHSPSKINCSVQSTQLTQWERKGTFLFFSPTQWRIYSIYQRAMRLLLPERAQNTDHRRPHVIAGNPAEISGIYSLIMLRLALETGAREA